MHRFKEEEAADAYDAQQEARRSAQRSRDLDAEAEDASVVSGDLETDAESDAELDARASGSSGGAQRYSKAAGRWTSEEHALLQQLVGTHGTKRAWSLIAGQLPGRTGKQCRERYLNHLGPNSKRGEWTPEEDFVLAFQHTQHQTHWSKIAKSLPGRCGRPSCWPPPPRRPPPPPLTPPASGCHGPCGPFGLSSHCRCRCR
jgi:hypothetical protein